MDHMTHGVSKIEATFACLRDENTLTKNSSLWYSERVATQFVAGEVEVISMKRFVGVIVKNSAVANRHSPKR